MAIFEGKFDKRFNTIEWKEETITFKHNGKAPKEFGEGVFRFNAPIALWAIMSKRGWQVIKKSRNFVYLKPSMLPIEKSFEAAIKIPTDDQIIHIATELEKDQKSVAGLLGEWPFFFIYKQKVTASLLENDPTTGKIVPKEYSSWNLGSYLVIGESNVWRKTADFRNGKFELSNI